MARGDFRGSVGTVIQAPSVSIHNTTGGAVDFRAGSDGSEYEMQQVLEAVRDIRGAAEYNLRRHNAEQRQQVEEAERELEYQDKKRQSMQADISLKRFYRDSETFFKNLPEEDLGLPVEKFTEKYKDSMPKLEAEGVSDAFIKEQLTAEANLGVETYHKARLQAHHRGKLISTFTAMADSEADDMMEGSSLDIKGIVADGRDAKLNDSEIWSGLMSTARSQLAKGNSAYIEQVYQYAADNIDKPDLRSDVLQELAPMYANARGSQKAKKTMQEVVALNKAQTFAELDAVFNSSLVNYSAEERVSAYSKVESKMVKAQHLEYAKGIADATGDLTAMSYELQRGGKTEGSFGFHEYGMSASDADAEVDKHFKQVLQTDPEKAAMLVRNSATVPLSARRSVSDLFNVSLNTGQVNPNSASFQQFMLMDAMMEDDRTGFINKFKLEGDSKLIYTLYALEKDKGMRQSNEESLQYAIERVRYAKENESFGDVQEGKKALQSLFDDESYAFNPRMKQKAMQSLQTYIMVMEPEAAARAAFEDANLTGASIGDYRIDNGAQLQQKLTALSQQFNGVMPVDLLNTALGENVEHSDYTFSYDDKHDDLVLFDHREGISKRIHWKDIERAADKEYENDKTEKLNQRIDLHNEFQLRFKKDQPEGIPNINYNG